MEGKALKPLYLVKYGDGYDGSILSQGCFWFDQKTVPVVTGPDYDIVIGSALLESDHKGLQMAPYITDTVQYMIAVHNGGGTFIYAPGVTIIDQRWQGSEHFITRASIYEVRLTSHSLLQPRARMRLVEA